MEENNSDRSKARLDEQHEWPCVYMFKFIMLNNEEKTEEFFAIFSGTVDINRKYSKDRKYVSYTVDEVMVNADAVLARYKEVGQIEGVIAL